MLACQQSVESNMFVYSIMNMYTTPSIFLKLPALCTATTKLLPFDRIDVQIGCFQLTLHAGGGDIPLLHHPLVLYMSTDFT